MKKILVLLSLLVFVGVYSVPALIMPKDVVAKIVTVDKDKKVKADKKADCKKNCGDKCKGTCKEVKGNCCGEKAGACCGVGEKKECKGKGECTKACKAECKKECGSKCEGKKAEEKK